MLKASLKSGIQGVSKLRQSLTNIWPTQQEQPKEQKETKEIPAELPPTPKKFKPHFLAQEQLAKTKKEPTSGEQSVGRMSYSDIWAAKMVDEAFDEADIDKDNKISFEEFKVWAPKDRRMTALLFILGPIN